jgi:hypothetical protein
MDEQLSRIAKAFERIADSLETINTSGLHLSSIDGTEIILKGPLCLQHEFPQDVPLGLLHVEPNQIDGFQIDVKND